MVRRNIQCQHILLTGFLYSRGLTHLDLCHVEAVQSSHRRCLLAAIIRAGHYTHQQYLLRETVYDQYLRPCFTENSLHHKLSQEHG